jgi:hypothetical protein
MFFSKPKLNTSKTAISTRVFLIRALLRARILQLLPFILKHPMHIQYEVYMDYLTRLVFIRRLVIQLASAAG